MASPAQMTANLANADLSTGPSSEEGKFRSSHNALTHGATSRRLFLDDERPEDLDRLRASVIQHYRPETEYECMLTDAVVITGWRYTRLLRIENAFLAERAEALGEETSLGGIDALALLFSDPVQAKKASLMLRYVSSAQRLYAQAVAAIQKAVKQRQLDEGNSGSVCNPSQMPAPAAQPAISRQERRWNERAERKAARKNSSPYTMSPAPG
ncbi:MAG: hypothetical protein H7039_12195 [Bryobacteraceae bacterium]|nr:hypothetical protein [Bryobacteraceae bacterium]